MEKEESGQLVSGKKGAREKIVVRRADKKHLYSITVMTEHFFPYTGFSYSEILRRLETKNIFYYVATSGGHSVGFVDFELKEKSAQILGLAVLDEYRNHGIGGMLLEKALSEIKYLSKHRSHAIERVDLMAREANPAALKLYEKFGFQKHGKLEKQLWGQDILVYSKYLH